MFERFTEPARRVVVLAQDESRILKHDHIGTEHLLLGLLREEEGVAAAVLDSLGVTAEAARAQVARVVGVGEAAGSAQVPFTRRAKKALEFALHESLGLGHDAIGTEHVLLGLVRDEDSPAARILASFDASPEKVRGAVMRTLSSPGMGFVPAPPGRRERPTRTGGWTRPAALFVLACPVCRSPLVREHGAAGTTAAIRRSGSSDEVECPHCATRWSLTYTVEWRPLPSE